MENDLSDNQRRFICRVLFLLVCALPTFVIVYISTHQRTADQWAQLVQAELGVETSIGGVESPRPGEFLFRDVKLYDDQGTQIFYSLKADVSVGNTNRIDFRSQIEITRAGMCHFLEEASGRLVKPRTDLKPWSIFFHDLEIIDESAAEFSGRPFHSNGVLVELGNGINGANVTLEANEWGKFELKRDSTNGEFKVAIRTVTDGAIPCWLVKEWFPELNQLGSEAHFSGVAGINSLGGSSSCAVTGNFINVELPEIPELDFATAEMADVIQVNSLEVEGAKWKKGKAWVLLGHQQLEIPNHNFDMPTREPAELIHQAIRSAFRDVWDGKVQYR